jgi:hypothetical protein
MSPQPKNPRPKEDASPVRGSTAGRCTTSPRTLGDGTGVAVGLGLGLGLGLVSNGRFGMIGGSGTSGRRPPGLGLGDGLGLGGGGVGVKSTS